MIRRSLPFAILLFALAMPGGRVATAGVNPALANIPLNTWVHIDPKSFDANGVDITASAGWPWNAFSGMCYDSDHKAIIMFGGGGHGGRRGNDVWMYDTGKNEWRMQYFPDPVTAYPYSVDDDTTQMKFAQYCQTTDLYSCNPPAQWLPRGTTSTKRPWTAHSYDQMTYDPVNHKFILIGPNFIFGYAQPLQYGAPDAFAYDIATKTWSKYATSPNNYHQQSRTEYDPIHKVVIEAGRTWTWPGYSWIATPTCYALDVTTGVWSKRATPPMWGGDANLVWDTVYNRMLMYGQDYPTTADLWAYDAGTDVWTQLHPLPDPVFGVPPVGAPNAAFDSANGILLILGQSDAPYIPTWAYNVRTNTWKKMNATNDPGGAKVQIGANLIYDPENNVFFLNAYSQTFSTIGGYYGERGEMLVYRYGASAPDNTAPAAVRNLTSP